MATISYQVGMTMHIGHPSNNEYVKKTMEVKDFEVIPGETEDQFVERIQQIHSTYHNLVQWADAQLADAMLDALKKESA